MTMPPAWCAASSVEACQVSDPAEDFAAVVDQARQGRRPDHGDLRAARLGPILICSCVRRLLSELDLLLIS